VFEIWNVGPDYEPEQIWALNPSSRTWRRLHTDTSFPRIDHSVVVAGDLLLMWNRPSDIYQGPPTRERAASLRLGKEAPSTAWALLPSTDGDASPANQLSRTREYVFG
jgi:hypothetical protein